MLNYILTAILSYLLGSFPTGVAISTRKFGIDVREMGSGNIGATNVTRVFGWYAGLLTFVIDFLKGAVPVWWLQKTFPNDPWMLTTSAVFLVLGHCFSAYLKFRGGKGVATSFGCVAVVAPLGALIAGIFYVILLITTRISAVGSLAGVLVCWIYLGFARTEPSISFLILGVTTVVLLRHQENISRLVVTFKERRKK